MLIFFRVVERGRTKCAQYWGPEPGDEVQAGGFTVTTLDVDTNPDYTISMLVLTNNKVCKTYDLICLFRLFVSDSHIHIYFCRFRLTRRKRFVICCIRHGRITVSLNRLQFYCSSCL